MLARYDCSKRRSGRGGRVDRRGWLETSSTISDGIRSDEVVIDLMLELGECSVAILGSLTEAAVDGFIS